ncbi:MAG: phosphoserine phosphatase SerB [Pseudomonadota bacterium]
MSIVTTLIARPAQAHYIVEAAKRLDTISLPFQRSQPLARYALDVHVDIEADKLDTLKHLVGLALHGLPIDHFVQVAETRRKKLLMADMDSTMIGQECVDELAALVGIKSQVSSITERAMRGEIEFEPALRARVALLSGIETKLIDQLIENHITLNPGAQTLIQTMVANGTFTALVSGGFTIFTEAIAERCGFDMHKANTLEFNDERLTGTVKEPILGQQAKRDALNELCRKHRLKPHETVAIGDGANDLAMLDGAGLGVAYYAKPAVAEAADARIDHTDLTSLLFAQGYQVDEFVGEAPADPNQDDAEYTAEV